MKGKLYKVMKSKEEIESSQLFNTMLEKIEGSDSVYIDGKNLLADSIYAKHIRAGEITADHIKSNTITADHLDVGRIDVAELWGKDLILPGEDYGGVTINNNGLTMKSVDTSGAVKLDIKLSSKSGFNITDGNNNQLIDIDPLTGNMKLQVSQLVIGGYKAATENKLEERINDIELTPGPAGPEGKGVSTVVREFQNSNSGTTIPTGNWSETSNPVKGQYMWERVTTNYTKGTPDVSHSVTYSAKDGTPGSPGAPGTPGTPGEAGVGVSGDKVEYSSSTSGTDIPTSGWGSSIPSVPEGQFLWTRTTITYTNDEKTETYTSAKQGEKGEPGADAISGVLTNESITFAANSSGTIENYVGNTGNFLLMEGAINRSSLASVTYSKVSNSEINVSATIKSDGSYIISSMTGGTSITAGQVTFRATYKGTTIDKTVSVSKSVAGTTGQPGSPGAPGAPGEPGSPGAPGNPGAPATSYWLTSSVDTITVKYNGDYDPKTITYYGHSKTGSNNTQNYAGQFIIQTSINGVNFTEAYKSPANMDKVDFSVPEDVLFIKAKFYQAGGTTYLLDEQTTPILHSADGLKGVGLEDKDYQVGTEIYTDKADDSLVRVEVDGKSYQYAGSGKNLFVPTRLKESHAVKNESELKMTRGSEIFYPIDALQNQPYTSSFNYKHDLNYAPIFMSFYYDDGSSDGGAHGLLSETSTTKKIMTSKSDKKVVGLGYNALTIMGVRWDKSNTSPKMSRMGVAFDTPNQTLGVSWDKTNTSPIMERVGGLI